MPSTTAIVVYEMFQVGRCTPDAAAFKIPFGPNRSTSAKAMTTVGM